MQELGVEVEPECLQPRKYSGQVPGEREAITLAETLRADALIIDEKIGRREAERRKLRVIGTVRVLDDAAEAGLVVKFFQRRSRRYRDLPYL